MGKNQERKAPFFLLWLGKSIPEAVKDLTDLVATFVATRIAFTAIKLLGVRIRML